MAETTEAPIRPRAPRAKPVKTDPQLPELAKIDNDIIVINPQHWFCKRYEDIVEAAGELPVVLEYINESLQRAAIATAQSKRNLEELEAETYTAFRQGWNEKFAEKMTEKALEMAVLRDRTFAKASENFSVLKSYVGRLAHMQENLRAKLDMLRSVEATKRRTINDGPDND